MINDHNIRNLRRNGWFDHDTRNMPYFATIGRVGVIIVVAIAILCVGLSLSYGQDIPYNKAVGSIIGEAENQGSIGMLAVACTIRNRGTLKGVYGWKNPRVIGKKYSRHIHTQAMNAWEFATNGSNPNACDFIHGSTGWGNKSDVKIFKSQKWFENCTIKVQIKDHYFYKCSK